METSALAGHLEGRYGIAVERVVAIESVFRVDQRDAPSWIARVFPPARPIAAVEGDAEILMFLEAHGFPAERCADPEPVSVLDGSGVLVTAVVPGRNGRPDRTQATQHAMGDLLGRLQALPEAEGAVARPAGSWHHLSVAGGARRSDVLALEQLMVREEQAPLRAELAGIDLLEELPHALVHPDFVTANAMLTPDGPVIVDWTSAGRGPRVAAFGWLLACTAGDVGLVDAIVDGYRSHIELEPSELERLGGAVRAFGLILDCWTAVYHARLLPRVVHGLAGKREEADAIAARARSAFEAG